MNSFGFVSEKQMINKRLIFSCEDRYLKYLEKFYASITSSVNPRLVTDVSAYFQVILFEYTIGEIEKSKFGYQFVCQIIDDSTLDIFTKVAAQVNILLEVSGYLNKVRCDALSITDDLYLAYDVDERITYNYALIFIQDNSYCFEFYDSLDKTKEVASLYTTKLRKNYDGPVLYEGKNNVRILKVIRIEDYFMEEILYEYE